MLPDARGPASELVLAMAALAFRIRFAALEHRDLCPQARVVIKCRQGNANCTVCGAGGASVEGQGLGAKQDPKGRRIMAEFQRISNSPAPNSLIRQFVRGF
jgi:hypothetical protein